MTDHDLHGSPPTCRRCGMEEEGLLERDKNCHESVQVTTPMIQLQVTLLDGSFRFYAVDPETGWKIDTGNRCLLIGKGLGRVYVPLDNVESFSPVQY